MGNLLSNNYSLTEINDLKNTVGTVSPATFDANLHPAELNGLFGTKSSLNVLLDGVAVPEDDKELLNRFLVALHNNIKLKYHNNKYLEECESAQLVDSGYENLNNISSEEYLNTLNDILPEPVESSKIKAIASSYCVYRFPESTLRMFLRVQKVPLESITIGVNDSHLALFSPNQKPEETPNVLIRWLVYELDESEIHVVPTLIEGVEVEENKVVRHDTGSLHLLEEACDFLNEKNDRSMKFKLDQFNTWKKKIDTYESTYALVGGEQVGTMDSYNEFFEKLDLSQLV